MFKDFMLVCMCLSLITKAASSRGLVANLTSLKVSRIMTNITSESFSDYEILDSDWIFISSSIGQESFSKKECFIRLSLNFREEVLVSMPGNEDNKEYVIYAAPGQSLHVVDVMSTDESLFKEFCLNFTLRIAGMNKILTKLNSLNLPEDVLNGILSTNINQSSLTIGCSLETYQNRYQKLWKDIRNFNHEFSGETISVENNAEFNNCSNVECQDSYVNELKNILHKSYSFFANSGQLDVFVKYIPNNIQHFESLKANVEKHIKSGMEELTTLMKNEKQVASFFSMRPMFLRNYRESLESLFRNSLLIPLAVYKNIYDYRMYTKGFNNWHYKKVLLNKRSFNLIGNTGLRDNMLESYTKIIKMGVNNQNMDSVFTRLLQGIHANIRKEYEQFITLCQPTDGLGEDALMFFDIYFKDDVETQYLKKPTQFVFYYKMIRYYELYINKMKARNYFENGLFKNNSLDWDLFQSTFYENRPSKEGELRFFPVKVNHFITFEKVEGKLM